MLCARRGWLTLHWVLGLSLGGLFALLGLTGSVLVFYPEIDRALHPQLRASAPGAQPSAEAILQRLTALHPQRQGPWRIELPLTAEAPVTARYLHPVERKDHLFAPLVVTLDPHTLQVTSERFWGDDPMTWIYDLHYTLLLQATGKTMVGIAGLLMMLSLLSGLYLWWPSLARWRAAMRPVLRPGRVRKTYDLHVLVGVYSLLVLGVLALTGAALALPDTTRTLVGAFSPLSAPVRPLYEPDAVLPPLGLDQAVAIARDHFPGAEVRWLEADARGQTPVSVRLYQPGEPGRRFPKTQVWLHPQTGEVLAKRDPFAQRAGHVALDWLHPLHNGEALGTAGRWLVFIAGLLPLLLFVTGWLRWRQKRHARRMRPPKRHIGMNA